MDSETWVRYAKRRKAQSIRRLREMVGKEEFEGHIERLTGLGRITAEEVAAALILEGSVGTIETDHIDRAIALVTEHGVLCGGRLHALLGLDPDDHPSEILAEALADGRLIKDGKEWMLGVGPAREAEVITYLPTAAAVLAFPKVELPSVAEKRERDGRTWAQLAVDFLRKADGNRATAAQLRVALGLYSKSGLNAFLQHGIITGRLARAGADWILGEKERMAA